MPYYHQINSFKHLVPPPNGLFETLNEYSPNINYVDLRTPKKEEKIVGDQELAFFFLTEDITKPKAKKSCTYGEHCLARPLIPVTVNWDNSCVTPTIAPCLGLWNALLRFSFNFLGIFQNECDMSDGRCWASGIED
ncbi:uncharacterized protein LOC108042911 [Drosophila rhopaloa]|uniref:Uncharacterized protein LOC108042911 n=1 Tax=Drosophila rhopaloa TaxID=1041015 RepID=A0A6P4EUW7_DRORH|nr:uncharacterized protein LOC108042911 [Drosophila rhopaloa]